MAAKKKEAEPELRRDPKLIEDFVNTYLTAYRDHVLGRNAEEHLPQFFKDYPFSIEVHDMPNGSVCALFKRSNRSKASVVPGDSDAIKEQLRDQAFDFMVVFPPFTTFTIDEAARLAKLDADRDLRMARRLELLSAAEKRMTDIHGDIQGVVDLNPWLDQQTSEQKRKLDEARELILELYREVETSREERFEAYAAQFSEMMAFEKGDIEAVAGEMAVQMESAIEEMDARISDIESRQTQLAVQAKEAESKLKALQKAGSVEELDEAVSDIEEELKSQAKAISAIQKQLESVKQDAEASREIRETVTRDSKRTYNLNERVTDLERSMNSLKSDVQGSAKSDVKALEGRINVMERDLKEYVRKCVEVEMGPRSVTTTSEPVVETTVEEVPGSRGVKKTTTTKKTTTKKTTRTK